MTRVVVNIYEDGFCAQLRWRIGPVRERADAGPDVVAHTHHHRHHHHHREAAVAFQLGDNQEVDLSVQETDTAGNAVEVSGVSFASSDEGVVTVADNGDGTALASATGTLGTATVTATDADDNLSGTLDFEIVTEAASAMLIQPGTPREQSGDSPTPQV